MSRRNDEHGDGAFGRRRAVGHGRDHQLLSGRRQADAAVGTGKQASAGLLLKDLNLLA